MRRSVRMLFTAALGIALTLPASAQMMGPMGQREGGMMGQGMGPGTGGPGGQAWSHEGPLITIMLQHKQELGLSPEQERKLLDLRTEFSKEWTRRTAEVRVAEIELDSLLEQERWDMGKIEPKVKQIAALQGDLRLARLRTLAAGRAVLTTAQLEKLMQVGHRMRSLGGPGMMGPGGFTGPAQPMMPGHGGPPAPRQ